MWLKCGARCAGESLLALGGEDREPTLNSSRGRADFRGCAAVRNSADFWASGVDTSALSRLYTDPYGAPSALRCDCAPSKLLTEDSDNAAGSGRGR